MAYTTIDDPSIYFNQILYGGLGDEHGIKGFGFQPDWVWVKRRDGADNHSIFDSNRGATKELNTNGAGAESTGAQTLKSFDSDGFTVGTNAGMNYPTETYVAWGWKANAATTTSNGASGDIKASTTQREDTAKFSICTYTGTGINSGQSHRVNHGLGTTPHLMLFKNRGAGSTDWVVYHHKNTADPETDYLVLNSTAGTADNVDKFGDTAPGSAYATIGGDDNISSNTMVLYSFAEVQGYSKFGLYVGNGNADGLFQYCGFKPAWIMIKRTDTTDSWKINDIVRDKNTQYGNDASLHAESSDGETTSASFNVDFLSNGFKLRSADAGANASDGTYAFVAFAQAPQVTSNGTPATAR